MDHPTFCPPLNAENIFMPPTSEPVLFFINNTDKILETVTEWGKLNMIGIK